ncbi:porphobilinogen synthase [Leptospira ilyithenensis]|uniref:Delta-aminolevulinic acid dehydratase n=1 Tax=Leptospira ilyithenensis TaxID=2484901 RepID=A0A4R9LRT3_9LEPT|nr:porphobilinogen synthase [Leptospira ilyithenensis]TGN11650.1 porphobilinogen synthase [Leptospira ilyithenensis]
MNHLRRIKKSHHLRELSSSSSLNAKKFIQPLFIVEDLKEREAIDGMSGVYRESESSLYKQIESDMNSGVDQFLLFTVPKKKSDTEFSSSFYNKAISGIKKNFPDIFLWLDTCLCSVTTHGHCGHLDSDGTIHNEKSVKRLSNLALLFAESGADGIAPSDMMDGRVASHRNILDSNGFNQIPIMSYSTKFKSNFYGPFRDAAESTPSFGDRSTYQLDVRDRESAIAASVRDEKEGADFLMLKPGMTSIDLILPIREKTNLPLGAYQVSGEYASVELLAKNGFLKREEGLVETWNVFRRAGVSFLISYAAREAKRLFI